MRKLLWTVVAAGLVLTGCSRLPGSLRSEVDSENRKLEQAKNDLERAEATIKADLAKDPDLFNGANVATEWPARLSVAKAKLVQAEAAKKSVEQIADSSARDVIPVIEARLAEQRRLRQAETDESARVIGEADRWLDFKHNLPQHLAKMNEVHEQLGKLDFTPVAQLVEKTERDWPAKKNDLDSRLNALRSAPERAQLQWDASAPAREAAAAGKAGGAQVATLILADNALSEAVAGSKARTEEITALSGQLYDAWDKILEDLEISDKNSDPVFREKLKTVRTHFTDVAAKKSEVSSDTRWVDVQPAVYRDHEDNLGMVVAHKDAGQYDSEANNIAQPPGFAYMAPPGERNQYGYWSAGPGGSVWTWLPQYLIMRELLWGRNYQPIYINEYNGYRTALGSGRSYYGTETPQAAPKYGTHGTFTKQSYAGSRYVQSGGFKSSGYANRQQSGGSTTYAPRPGATTSRPDTGRQFGRESDSPAAGRRFGAPGNADRRATPSAPPSGRRFGSPGGSRPSRQFGGGSRRR